MVTTIEMLLAQNYQPQALPEMQPGQQPGGQGSQLPIMGGFSSAGPQRTTDTAPRAANNPAQSAGNPALPPGAQTFGPDPSAKVGGAVPADRPGFARPGEQLQGAPQISDLLAAGAYEMDNPMDHADRDPMSGDPQANDPLLQQIREYAKGTMMELMRQKASPPDRGFSMAEAWAISGDPRLASIIMKRKTGKWEDEMAMQQQRLQGVQMLLGIGTNLQKMNQAPTPFAKSAAPGSMMFGAGDINQDGTFNEGYQVPYSPAQQRTGTGSGTKPSDLTSLQYLEREVVPENILGTPREAGFREAMAYSKQDKLDMRNRQATERQLDRYSELVGNHMTAPDNWEGKAPDAAKRQEFMDIAMTEGADMEQIRSGDYAKEPSREEVLSMSLPPGLAVPGNADEQQYQINKILERKYGAKAAALIPEGVKQQLTVTFYGNQGTQ